jgi:hypothetical protein
MKITVVKEDLGEGHAAWQRASLPAGCQRRAGRNQRWCREHKPSFPETKLLGEKTMRPSRRAFKV